MSDIEKISIVVDAHDNASATLGSVRSRLTDLSGGIGAINSALRQYNSAMSRLNYAMINVVREAGSAIYDFTSDSIQNFSELSEQHAKTLGAMANDYDTTLASQQKFIENSEKLRQQAIDIAKYGIDGQGSLVTSVEVSAVQTELTKAGVSADAMLNTNIVNDVLRFALANQLNTASAVEFAVSLGSQFGVSYENWGDMLDKVSHTADMSIIEVSDIVQSMKYAGGISSGIGRPMEEILGMIAVLGDFGLRGSQAGSGIQALLTRLLTGDTTVITQAQAEVAPERALQAFYDFSNYAKSDGSEITYEDILNETFVESDITGQLRPMEEVIDALETTMESLNDEEQAWFAKKLFGLYQMKSAYALINGDDSDISLSEVIKEIETNSTGTNANKLTELIDSQSGQISVTKNLIDSVKTELGLMLEPTTLAVLHEVQEFLKDPANYDINWEAIKASLDESCNSIEEAYGTAIADAVRNIGGLTIDLGQVIEEIAPEFLDGLLGVFNSALEGDFVGKDGVTGNWSDMIKNMKGALEDLPPGLQELGEKVIEVVDLFGKLATLNIATTVAQLITSALQLVLLTISAGSVIVNGGVGGGTGAGGGSVIVNAGSVVVNGNVGTGTGGGTAVVGTGTGTGTGTGGTGTGGTGTGGTSLPNGNLIGMGVTALLWREVQNAIDVYNGEISKDSPYAHLKDVDADIVVGLGTGQYVIDKGELGWALDDKITDQEGNVIVDFGDSLFGAGVDSYERALTDIMAWNSATQEQKDEWHDIGLSAEANVLSAFTDYINSIESLNDKTIKGETWLTNPLDATGIVSVVDKEYNFDPAAGVASVMEYNGMPTSVMDKLGLNPVTAIPGYNAMSNKGQQEAVQDYLNTQISVTPSFTMDAPQIQVNVTIDNDGNVISQDQSILNPGFSLSMNSWYQRSIARVGSTSN